MFYRYGHVVMGIRVIMVGARGFEPPTSCSQGRRASQTALRPVLPLINGESATEGFYYTSGFTKYKRK